MFNYESYGITDVTVKHASVSAQKPRVEVEGMENPALQLIAGSEAEAVTDEN